MATRPPQAYSAVAAATAAKAGWQALLRRGKVKADILGDVDPPPPRLRRVKKSLDQAGRSTQVPEDTWDHDKTGGKEPPYNRVRIAHERCSSPTRVAW